MAFSWKEVLPDVIHIEDSLGVCMTLTAGSREALLADTGYGLENVAAFAASLTDRPVRLVLTHGHYDHILGARWFPEAYLFEEDMELAGEQEKTFWRKRALNASAQKGIQTEEAAFLSAPVPVWKRLEEGWVNLGGLSARIIRCPGHTPGSAVLFIPERELLLTGDNWNPCTWLFFPEALPAQEYIANMRRLLELPFKHVLCPHSPELYGREMLEDFVLGLTEEKLRTAERVDTGDWLGIRTCLAEPAPGQCFVFDADKARIKRSRENG